LRRSSHLSTSVRQISHIKGELKMRTAGLLTPYKDPAPPLVDTAGRGAAAAGDGAGLADLSAAISTLPTGV